MPPPDPGTVYEDDPTITDDEVLYRLIKTANVKWDGTVAERVGTNAFQDQREDTLAELGVPATAVSVLLGSVLEAAGISVQEVVTKWGPDYGLAEIAAGAARNEGQGIVRWPTDDDQAHAMIFTLQGPRKSSGQSKRLAKAARLVVPPLPPGQPPALT